MCSAITYPLAIFAGAADAGHGDDETLEPAKPAEELLADFKEALAIVANFLTERNVPLENIIKGKSFARNASIIAAKEAVNQNDETRKRFEIQCREVFKKFKACINIKEINNYRNEYDAVNILYKSLQKDRDAADITSIIQQLHGIVDDAIDTTKETISEDQSLYDISRIDFERLRKEFEKSPAQRTTVQNLREAIEQRLQRLLMRNPLRTDFQHHFEQIVADYNREKNSLTIEQTFEALLKFVNDLTQEELRAIREGLDEESLALFDLLKKPDLSRQDIKRVKEIAVDLLQKLKEEKLRIDHWRDKETTRDAVRVTIRDYLWSEETGLPVDVYTDSEVQTRAEDVYRHIYRAYPTIPSPYYSKVPD